MTLLSEEVTTGDGRKLKVEDVARVYRDVVSLSIPSDGKIQKRGDTEFNLLGYFRTMDCDTLENKTTFKAYSLKTKTIPGVGRCIDSVRCITDAHDAAELAIVTSDDGRFTAKLKSSSCEAPNEKQLLEIWERSRLLKTIDVSESDIHGPINTDVHFSSIEWSRFGQQDKLLYVCQPKRPKLPSFFEPKGSTDSDRGEKYVKRATWGEGLTSIEHTVVAVLDVANDCSISIIDVKGFSLAESKWLDEGTKIVSVAYKEEPKRLGLIYCNNRPSKIVVHDWQAPGEGFVSEIEGPESYHTIRVNNKGNQFLYLSSTTHGAHKHSVKMHLYDVITRSSEQLIDKKTKKENFFVEKLTNNCFTSDDRSFLLVIYDYIHQHMCFYSLDKMELTYVKFPTTGVALYDLKHDIILASGSELNTTPTLFVAALDLLNANDLVAWHQIEECLHLEEINYETFKIPTEDSSFVSAIMVTPDPNLLQENLPSDAINKLVTDPAQLPTIVTIHGGPHSNFTVNYIPVAVFYARLGLKSLLINYRGSTGVDEDYIQVLNGRIGELDVADCMHILRHLVKEKLLNPQRLIVNGGSHGGFLACHLSCQDEFKFTSAVIRNPVVDLSSLHASSDIPDWCYNQALSHKYYDSSWYPGAEDLKKLFECSPIAKASKAYPPTLLCLGSQDLRVNMYQGERWVDILRARGIETLCKIYSDKHDLAKSETSADFVITAALWSLNHLPTLS